MQELSIFGITEKRHDIDNILQDIGGLLTRLRTWANIEYTSVININQFSYFFVI